MKQYRSPLTIERARRLAKRLGIPPASQPTERERKVEAALRRDVEAKLALERLERAGVPVGPLVTWITMAAFSSPRNLPQADHKAKLREMSTQVEAFQILPRKVRELATTVAQANELGWLNPMLAILGWQGEMRDLKRSERKQVADDFYYLPQILEWYASCAEHSLMRQRRIVRYLKKTSPNLKAGLERALVQDVHRITGKYYFERVAALLRVALYLAGEEKQANEMNGDSLRIAYQRFRKVRKQH